MIVEHVGRHAANDERCVVVDEDRGGNLRPRSRKFTTADFEARGGYLKVDERMPSVASRFLGGH